MTLKYESDILASLMERDGDNIPSSNPLYESELKEKYLSEVVGGYPKLTDYTSEWLNYNLEHHIPADFPTESLVNVTSGTVNNVVPYVFKSAILKGNTLKKDAFVKWSDKYGSGVLCPIYHSETIERSYKVYANRDYTVIRRGIWENVAYSFYNDANKYVQDNITSDIFTPSIDGYIQIFINGDISLRTTQNQNDFIVIEGRVDKNIPYFEGMQSVKMPVLMVYNQENLFKNYIKDGSHWGKDYNCTTTDIKYSQNGSYVKITGGNTLCYSGFVSPSLPRGTYKFSCKVKVGQVGDSYSILAHNNPNSPGNITSGFASGKITSTKEIETFEYVGYFANANNMLLYTYYKGQEIEYYDIVFTKLSDDNVVEDYKVNPQKYEYKTNILTVNEDVTLRGIGDVKDTLDCLTGKVIERVREVVLNGTEEWTINNSNNEGFFSCSTTTYIGINSGEIICDKLPTITSTKNEGVMVGATTGKLMVSFNRDKTGVTSLAKFKEKLSQLQLKVCYEIENVDKTVDLNVTDEKNQSTTFRPIEGTMNIQTDGKPLKPLLDMEVPVEAITQNLASFIEE